jgi:dipeptidyl aminopeptidase/acylaminoacyl peptidase
VLLFQGTADKDVPYEWSDHLAKRLTELGKNITYVQYKNEGHEFAGKWSDFMEKSAEFFHQNLDRSAGEKKM